MNTNTLLMVAALALPASALAQVAVAPATEPGYTEKVYARYCEKLREGPEAFAQFVHAKRVILGYTHTDFAPANPGDPVRADCRLQPPTMQARATSEEPRKLAEKSESNR